MTGPLGVGFVGAGPVTQAIHLPTPALLTRRGDPAALRRQRSGAEEGA